MGRRWEAAKTVRKWWLVEARLRTSEMEVQDWKMCSTSSVARSSNSIAEVRQWASGCNSIILSFILFFLQL